MNIWRTFIGVTVAASVVLAGIASLFQIATPTLSVNSLGMVVSAGDVVETILAAVIGAVAAVLLRKDKKREQA